MPAVAKPDVADAVVAVGSAGRGFFVADPTRSQRFPPLLITAAHCLPRLPPAHPASYDYERCYPRLLGPLGADLTVMARCLFVDPISDVAILGAPDAQSFSEEAEEYAGLANGRPLLPLAYVAGETQGRILALDGRWQACTLSTGHTGYDRLSLGDGEKFVDAGMSGSPILDARDHAVGVVTRQDAHPNFARDLPRWFVVSHRTGRAVIRTWQRE